MALDSDLALRERGRVPEFLGLMNRMGDVGTLAVAVGVDPAF